MTQRVVLPNGLRLLVREMRAAPVVALNLWVGTGSSDDPQGLSGSAHFIEHMLFRRGEGGEAVDLARTVQSAGGHLNAETGCDHTMYYQMIPSARWKDVLGPAIQAVAMPALLEADVESERGVVIEEARSRDSDPAMFVWHRLVEAALKGRPCGRPIVGTPDSVARITPAGLREHHATHYRGTNLVQVIVGDVDAHEAIDFASAMLEQFPGGEVGRQEVGSGREPPGPRGFSHSGRVEQPYVAIGFEGPPALNEDVPALDALCGLLGVGRSSRLSRSLRTADGLVSDIGCGLVAYRSDGLIVVRAVAATRDVDRVVEGVLREVELVRRDQVGGVEMEKNLTRLEAGYVLEHETSDSMAGVLGYFETLGDYEWAEEYVDRLARVSADDVSRVARKYLDPERATGILYVPGEPGAEPTDTSDVLRRRWDAARSSLPESLREAPAAWSPPQSLSRPDLLREAPRAGCSTSVLDGGGGLIVCESSALPLVSLTIGFRGGFAEEGSRESGITYLAEKMAVLGTRSRTADEISEAIEGLGSGLASAVERDGFGLGFTVLSKHLREAVHVVADVVANASFPDDMLSRAKAMVLSEMIEAQDNPFRRAILELLPLAFPGHPYGRPIRGTPETLTALELERIGDWHRAVCTRERMAACVVGDIEAEEAESVMTDAFSAVPTSSGLELGTVDAAQRAASPVGSVVRELPGSPQSIVAVCVGAPCGGTEEAVVGRVIVRALSMMGGRLWRELRERPPHAYRVGGTMLAYAQRGASVAYATSAPGEERAVADGLVNEFRRLVSEGLEPDELERTKRHLAGSIEISLVRSAARSSSYAMAEVMGSGYEYVERLAARVRNVTREDVARVASAYMDPALGCAEVILKGGPPVK